MDSEDDIHDVNDTDLYDSYSESESDGYATEEEYDDVSENASDDQSEENTSSSRPPYEAMYTILSEQDILKRQKEAITDVSEVLNLSKIEAGILLRRFQ